MKWSVAAGHANNIIISDIVGALRILVLIYKRLVAALRSNSPITRANVTHAASVHNGQGECLAPVLRPNSHIARTNVSCAHKGEWPV